ncbi:MAG TPA: GTP 3',8-cyclase MoaA [Rhodocyclaceae bacterium]
MNDRFPLATPPVVMPPDRRGRMLRDLRISITDRCNFRCTYCMPKEVFTKDYPYLERSALLSFEEITRVARITTALGVEKIRLTGGEPLLRKGMEGLVASLSEIPNLDLALTTNGALLAKKAAALRDAGLKRITVSLDALDDGIFRRMNDVDFPVDQVLAGIDAAAAAGLGPVKINVVVKRGVNVDEILPLCRHFRGTGHVLRFIEYMDVGCTNGWRMDDVVPSAEVLEIIGREFPLEPLEPHSAGEVAQRWRYADGGGEVGVISSVTRAFCKDCTRLRLSTEGKLYTCLFATNGFDLRSLIRSDVPDAEISAQLAQLWAAREDRYSELRAAGKLVVPLQRIEMSYIGG